MTTGPGDTASAVADTSWLSHITVVQVIGAILVLALIGWGIRKAIKLTRPIGKFLEDWNGEPQRPGVPARLGVMARLESIDARLADTPTRHEMTEVQQHLARHDVQIAQLMPHADPPEQ